MTVSVALGGVLIIKWTYDYPLIRLVASVILFFCAIYLMRVLALGLAFFVGAGGHHAQTFPSMTSQSEICAPAAVAAGGDQHRDSGDPAGQRLFPAGLSRLSV